MQPKSEKIGSWKISYPRTLHFLVVLLVLFSIEALLSEENLILYIFEIGWYAALWLLAAKLSDLPKPTMASVFVAYFLAATTAWIFEHEALNFLVTTAMVTAPYVTVMVKRKQVEESLVRLGWFHKQWIP